ncbi:hypothetical protein A45J_1489 [hot springs metagenome]|uniref:General secretion pathway protein GspM n=1 Tax=hot springs metagenome TaxID=433727 RepID=A0A5J4L1U5_9ZZZZ
MAKNSSYSCFIISGILFLTVLSGAVISKRYANSLHDMHKKLQTVKMNHVLMKEAVIDMEKTMTDLKTIVPSDFGTKMPEDRIFTAIDDLKFRMKDYEINVANIGYNGEEVNMPVTIKSSISRKTATKSYAGFVNNIGYLQSMSFPFFSISSISMKQSQDKVSVICEIRGTLKTIKTEDRGQRIEDRR